MDHRACPTRALSPSLSLCPASVPKRQHRHLGYFPAGEVDDDGGGGGGAASLQSLCARARSLSDRVETGDRGEERRGHRCLQSHFFRSPFFPRPPPAPPRSSIRRDQDCGKEGAPLVVRVSECQGMLRSALSSPALACLIKDDDERGITRYCLTLDL